MLQDEGRWSECKPSRATRRISARSRGAGRGELDGPAHRLRTESGLEMNAAYALLADPDVVDVAEQPAAVPYRDGAGKARAKTVDFMVATRDGRRVAVEVRPECRAAGARATMDLLAAQASAFADGFLVLTEGDVDRTRSADGRLVHDMRRHHDAEADAALAGLVSGLFGTTTVGELVLSSRLGARAFGAAVRLVGDGTLMKLDAGRLDYPSRVRRAPERTGAPR